LVRGKDGYSLVDLSNTNGTYVNGQRIRQKELESGDRICLGTDRIELRYFSGTDPSTEVVSSPSADLERSLHDLVSILPPESSTRSDLEKISSILDFQYQCERMFSGEKPFEHILESALKISGAERGYILLRQDERFEYVIGMDRTGQRLLPSDFRASQSAVRQVASDGNAIYMADGLVQGFAERQSILALNLRSLACLPLRWLSPESDRSEVGGVLYLDSTKRMRALSRLDEKILHKLAFEASNVFEKLEMIKTFEKRKSLEFDLALAQNELRAAEELRRAEIQVLLLETAASTGRFAAALSHELNSPLGALKATLQTHSALVEKRAGLPVAKLKETEAMELQLRQTAIECVERLHQIVQRMQRLTNLDRSEILPVNLNSLVGDVIEMLQSGLSEAVTIELRVQPLPLILVRPQRMSAVFLNLIQNAVEGLGGAGHVSVSTSQIDSQVEVLVEDTGRGISAEELAGIFDPAFKVKGGRVSTGNWSLFSSRQIVREHGGEIEIRSSPGKGTSVRVILPCQK
jgi:signal transduction histidine kinase